MKGPPLLEILHRKLANQPQGALNPAGPRDIAQLIIITFFFGGVVANEQGIQFFKPLVHEAHATKPTLKLGNPPLVFFAVGVFPGI